MKIFELNEKRKVMQLTVCLHAMQGGRAATSVEKEKALFQQLHAEGYMSMEVGVAKSHWGDNSVWEFYASLAEVERQHAKRDVSNAPFLSLSLSSGYDSSGYDSTDEHSPLHDRFVIMAEEAHLCEAG